MKQAEYITSSSLAARHAKHSRKHRAVLCTLAAIFYGSLTIGIARVLAFVFWGYA